MKKIVLKCLIPILTSLLSLIWIILGIKVYGFWDDVNGPSGGFFPVIIGCVLLIVSIITIINSRNNEPPEFSRDSFLLIAAIILIFAGSLIIGLLPSLLIFIIIWLKCLEKMPWKTTILTTVVMSALVYGVFVLWLKVSFPVGIVFEAINL